MASGKIDDDDEEMGGLLLSLLQFVLINVFK
jgi:hypothetical protein